jgi:hypothetical protein
MEYDKYSKFSDDTDGEPFQNSSIQRFSSVTSKLQSDSSYDITGSYVVNNLHYISIIAIFSRQVSESRCT